MRYVLLGRLRFATCRIRLCLVYAKSSKSIEKRCHGRALFNSILIFWRTRILQVEKRNLPTVLSQTR